MDVFYSFLVQLFNGLASASALYLVAAGLSLIFGVTKVVNFAHGAFFMLGLYLAISLQTGLAQLLGAYFGISGVSIYSFWGAVLLSTFCITALGAIMERMVLRRLYASPELFQLLATFAWVLIAQDAALWIWGAEETLGPRAPGLHGYFEIGSRALPHYDIFLVLIAPVVWCGLHLFLHKTRTGLNIRAASEDRGMAAALGIRQGALFCATFAIGCGLAAFGGALQMPREPASTALALGIVGDAFVVVVVGGLGSLGGAYIAALLIGVIKALCAWLGAVDINVFAVFGADLHLQFDAAQFTLMAEFLLMAAVLMFKPAGLFGKSIAAHSVQTEQTGAGDTNSVAQEHTALYAPQLWLLSLAALLLCGLLGIAVWSNLNAAQGLQAPYLAVLAQDLCIAALFALSLHGLIGAAGMPSFGHAALFGVGAYAAALATRAGYSVPIALMYSILLAALAAVFCGFMVFRLSGVYRAMFTLAFAQVLWAGAQQWDGVTGGSNGIYGVWPTTTLGIDFAAAGVWLAGSAILLSVIAVTSYRLLSSRWGQALRAVRDAPERAHSLQIPVLRLRLAAFVWAGAVAGLAGGLFAFAKGGVSPEALAVTQSVQGLVMVLLGGVNTVTGALAGAVGWVLLQDWVLRHVEYWRAALGGIILLLCLLLPRGIAGWYEAIQGKTKTFKIRRVI